MVSATYAKGKWKVKKVANVGDSPSITADSTGDAVLTFLQPKSTDATTGSNSVGVSVALPGKQFSSSVGAVHAGSATTNYLSPVGALDGSTAHGTYVEVGQSEGSSGATVTGGTGQTAIAGKKNKTLDNAGTSSRRRSPSRRIPGRSQACGAERHASGAWHAGQHHRSHPQRRVGARKDESDADDRGGWEDHRHGSCRPAVGPNAASKVSIPITVPADAMTVKNSTLPSASISQELGLPIVPKIWSLRRTGWRCCPAVVAATRSRHLKL